MTAEVQKPGHVRFDHPTDEPDRSVCVSLTGSNTLVGGLPGGGKSALLNHVLLQAITDKEN
jgi:predicted ATP-dependent serine protease